MQIKTPELIGPALDWAVALAEGSSVDVLKEWFFTAQSHGEWQFSTDWSQGGPIIEREAVTVGPYHGKDCYPTGVFQAYIGWDKEEMEPRFQVDGPTPLIAAMRCHVASKLGGTVDIPDELMKESDKLS